MYSQFLQATFIKQCDLKFQRRIDSVGITHDQTNTQVLEKNTFCWSSVKFDDEFMTISDKIEAGCHRIPIISTICFKFCFQRTSNFSSVFR